MVVEWFIYHKNSVLGPYTTEDVHSQLASGKANEDSFIWWKGQKDWIPVLQWSESYQEIITDLESNYNVKWRVRIAGTESHYMDFEECLKQVRNIELKDDIFINQESKDDWENIFTNSFFLNALEMSRRKYPRVPIVATAKISKAGSKFSYLVKVNIVGQGGIGISGLGKNFPTGTAVDIKLDSPSFTMSVVAEGKILYHTKEGVSGIEFSTVNAESNSVIIEYINRFEATKESIVRGSNAA